MKSIFLTAFALTAGQSFASLTDWETATAAGGAPAASFYFSTAGTGISGNAPVATFIGDFAGARSFEFIVRAGNTTASAALMGLTGVQGLKFEQNPDTGHMGITNYNVADHDSPVNCPAFEEAQVVYTSDGTDTLLYVNGVLRHTFTGVPLQLTGTVPLGAAGTAAGAGLVDRLDGHILGFASYASVLPAATITSHYNALVLNRPPVSLSGWQAAVNASSIPPAKTVFTPVSGMNPIVTNVGTFAGARTFEFVTYAGGAGVSGAMMGRGGQYGYKFEQWNNTNHLGLTAYGVADYDSGLLSPYYRLAHIAYVSDNTKTDLYVDGVFSFSFPRALTSTGNQIIGSGGNVTDPTGTTTFGDPLDGSVLRFASFDRALSDAEVLAHFNATSGDAVPGSYELWNAAVSADTPAVVRTEPAAGSAQTVLSVGTLSGARAFEFVVNAGINGASGALMGDRVQALKFEQFSNTGMLGITDYGVADRTSTTPSPVGADAHIVYSSDGTGTKLYVNGVMQFTFPVALKGTGNQGLATAASIPVLTATFGDRLDGHLLGFASYDGALTAADLAAHFTALTSPPVAPETFDITSVYRNAATGDITLTWNSSPGQTFSIVWSTDMAGFPNTVATGIPAGAGTSTTHTFPTPSAQASRLFFKVLRL